MHVAKESAIDKYEVNANGKNWNILSRAREAGSPLPFSPLNRWTIPNQKGAFKLSGPDFCHP